MSGYQYYEFQAVDRPLTSGEIAQLRALSTRATITPTRFVNVYHWGDFRGDPLTLMERYFDAFVYVANWGTNQLMLRLPKRVLDPDMARRYAVEDCVEVHDTGEHVILELALRDEDEAGWIEDEEAEGWMPSLLPVRAELAGGDLRGLYLGWLAGVRSEMLDDDAVEPPVPPGLGRLSASLEALARFLTLDDDLLAVAAERSTPPAGAPSRTDLERWVRELPTSDKDALLLRVLEGDAAHLRAELLGRFRHADPAQSAASSGGRTVAELLAAAEERAAARRRAEAERKAAERARRQAEQAAARAAYLDTLTGRDEELWRQVEALVETKRPKDYDLAVQLLCDLRDLAARDGHPQAFTTRLAELRDRHARKPSLLERLDRAGLPRS